MEQEKHDADDGDESWRGTMVVPCEGFNRWGNLEPSKVVQPGL